MKRFNVFSKYRNVVAKLDKDKTLSFPGTTLNTDGLDSCNLITASQHFMSYKSNGNNIGVISLTEYEKLSNNVITMGRPSIQAHSSTVNDIQFSPFAYDYLASVSSDKTLKLWEIPEDGLTENLNSALVTLVHDEDSGVNMVQFHPTVENIVSSATSNKVYVWDIENQKVINTFNSDNEIQYYSWKEDGSLFVRSLKANGNGLEIVDPRNSGTPITGAGHPGSKATRALWLGNTNNIVTTGFSRTRDREIFLWDTRNMGSTVFTSRMSFSPGILMPLFDSDTNLLYICGKGNNILLKYELRNNNLEDNNQLMVANSNFNGVGLVPKRALDVMQCEVGRLLQVSKDTISPISITVPRTNMRFFIPEIFPDTKGDESPLSTEEWINGVTKEVGKLSLDPAKARPAKSHNKNAKPKAIAASVPAQAPVEPAPKPSSGPVMPVQVSIGATVPSRSNPLSAKPNPLSSKPNPLGSKPNPANSGSSSTESLTKRANPLNSSSESINRRANPLNSSSESINRRANPLNSSSESINRRANPLNRSSSSVNVSDDTAAKENKEKDDEPPATPAANIAMKFGAQASSYRFMNGKVKIQYDNLSGYWDNLTNEIDGIEANNKFMAIPINGPGGRVAILKTRDSGRIPATMNCIVCGSTMTYYKFNPFNQNMILTGNENGNVQIWTIPDEGLTENLTEPDHTFSLFSSKTTLIEFNPLVENLVLVGGYDIGTGSTILKLIDVQSKQEVLSEHEDKITHPDFILNASWNYDGTKIATLCRDKNLRVIDMVKGEILKEGVANESNKGRVRWLGKSGKILSVGFDRQSHQEIKIFDENDLSKPLTTLSIDLSSSLLCVYYDEDTNLIYLYGRGESNIKIYEFLEGQDPCCRALLKINTESIQQGITFDNKKYLDIVKVEVNKAWVVSKDSIKCISFTVPRTKTEFFQDDLFTPTRDVEHASMTIDEWKQGQLKPLNTINLCPEGMKPLSENTEAKVIKSTAHLIRKADDKSGLSAKDEFVNQLMARVVDDDDSDDSDGELVQDQMEGLDDDEWD